MTRRTNNRVNRRITNWLRSKVRGWLLADRDLTATHLARQSDREAVAQALELLIIELRAIDATVQFVANAQQVDHRRLVYMCENADALASTHRRYLQILAREEAAKESTVARS